MRLRALLALSSVLILSVSCAALPSAHYDGVRALDTKDPRGHLDLLRQQDERIANSKFVGGNKVTLLRDGAATYPAMLAAIASAKHRIDMESFTFDEAEGGRFADALLKRSAAGVEVNVIYDSVGSGDTPSELFDRMHDGGIHMLEYNPLDPINFIDTSFNHRDHRKLLMVDGKVAFTGGINISEVYRMKLKLKKKSVHIDPQDMDPDHSPWRDTQVEIEGPVVGQFEHLFMENWQANDGDPISLPPPTSQLPKGDLLVLALDGTPDKERFSIYKSLLLSLALAHHSIHLTSAYFVPTPELVHALEQAAQRGLDVTLILPSQNDSDLALKAGHAYYEDLMEAGVKIYERQDAILHAKTAIIDGIWSTVGSSNLDWRSVLFNNECNAIILGAPFGQQMEAMFQDDIKHSERIDPRAWDDRPFWEKLDEWKARTLEYFL